MKMLTSEEIGQLSYERLYKQGELALTKSGYCVYHDPDNKNRCAVGILLTEDDAALAQAEIGRYNVKACKNPNNDINFEAVDQIFLRNGIDLKDETIMTTINAIQHFHDSVDSFDEWTTIVDTNFENYVNLAEIENN